MTSGQVGRKTKQDKKHQQQLTQIKHNSKPNQKSKPKTDYVLISYNYTVTVLFSKLQLIKFKAFLAKLQGVLGQLRIK